jgi:WD40 repeat protein
MLHENGESTRALVCTECGEANKSTARFCRKCGGGLPRRDARDPRVNPDVASVGEPTDSGAERGPDQITASTRAASDDPLLGGRATTIEASAASAGTAMTAAKSVWSFGRGGVLVLVLAIIIGVSAYFLRRPHYQPSESALNWVADAAFGTNSTVAVRTMGRGIHIFEVPSGRHVRHIPLYLSTYFRRPWSPDLSRFVLSFSPIQVDEFPVSGSPIERPLPTNANNVWDGAFNPDGRLLATADSQGAVEVRDVASGQMIRAFHGHTAVVWSVEFSPDGQLLASGSQDNTVRVWDIASSRQTHLFSGHLAKITSLRFSPDGHSLLSVADDRTARLWELGKTDQKTQEFFRPERSSDQLTSGAFSPDGRTIVLSAGTGEFFETGADKDKDGEVWLVDRKNGREIWRQKTPRPIKLVQFDREGKRLLVLGGGKAEVWEVATRRVVLQYPPGLAARTG